MINRTIDYVTALKNIRENINRINTMFIGTIVNADYSRNRYSIQPVLMYMGDDEIPITKAILVNCPMSFTKTKSFYIRAPYEVGDMVYVGCSKDSIEESVIDGSIRASRLSANNKFREVDGVILGGVMSDTEPVLSPEYTTDFLIQNRINGDLFAIKQTGGIEIKTSSDINITATSNINVNCETANVNASGSVAISTSNMTVSSPETSFSGNVHIGGGLMVDGDGTSAGTLRGSVVQTSGGIDLGSHIHGGVMTGGGNTSGPQ